MTPSRRRCLMFTCVSSGVPSCPFCFPSNLRTPHLPPNAPSLHSHCSALSVACLSPVYLILWISHSSLILQEHSFQCCLYPSSTRWPIPPLLLMEEQWKELEEKMSINTGGSSESFSKLVQSTDSLSRVWPLCGGMENLHYNILPRDWYGRWVLVHPPGPPQDP